LEKRTAALIERHATHVFFSTFFTPIGGVLNPPSICQVDALSELFVAWDDTITEAEDKISRLERDREERRRLGLE